MTSILAHRKPTDRSFERLYRAHVQDVYRYSLMLLRNRADAEDVAQTTFMKAYRAMQRGDRPRHPRKWLITIAHNTCRTRARHDSRRPQEVAFHEEIAEQVAPAPGADADVDVPELLKALGALSFNQRAALVMRELEGRSYAEIAEVLEISGSAVETLLFRARRALREQLEGSLTCGEAEHALSLQLDGRLESGARARLRAHLRECGECASLARRHRARRAALRSLGPLPLPASVASWGGVSAGSGVAVKVAALLAAGVAAAGASNDGAEAVNSIARASTPAVVAPAQPTRPAVARVVVEPTARERRAAVRARPPLRSRTTLVDEPAAARPRARAPSTPAPAAPTPKPAAPAAAPASGLPTAQLPPPVAEVATPPVAATVPVAEVTVSVPEVTVSAPPPPVSVEVPPLPLPTLP